jgi:hypothetical protein
MRFSKDKAILYKLNNENLKLQTNKYCHQNEKIKNLMINYNET